MAYSGSAQDTLNSLNPAMSPWGGLSFNPAAGPTQPLGPYNPTVGPQQNLYRQPGAGDSPWLALQKEQIGANTGRAVDTAHAGAAGAGANAWNQLATMGGVRSGAAQNLAGQTALAGDLSAQDARFKGSDQALQAGITDATNNAANQRFDVENQIKDAQMRNEYNLNKYNTEMGGWAAQQQANATRNSGGGGLFGGSGFLGLF